MVSASVRTYREGPQTLATRQRIVRDYLNSVPLSAAPGHGEVHGIADGLRLWFGADFREVNRLLDPRSPEAVDQQARGLALRQVLSLLIAQRRPSYYLGAGREEMAALTDSHIRLLANGGIIDTALRDAALSQRVVAQNPNRDAAIQPVEATKGITVARMRLAGLLGLPLYDLDRLDLTASTSLQGDLQSQISEYLVRLADPAFAESVGLFGDRMLSPEDRRRALQLHVVRARRRRLPCAGADRQHQPAVRHQRRQQAGTGLDGQAAGADYLPGSHRRAAPALFRTQRERTAQDRRASQPQPLGHRLSGNQ